MNAGDARCRCHSYQSPAPAGHAGQYLGQRAHGHAADTGQVNRVPGVKKLLKSTAGCIIWIPPKDAEAPELHYSVNYIIIHTKKKCNHNRKTSFRRTVYEKWTCSAGACAAAAGRIQRLSGGWLPAGFAAGAEPHDWDIATSARPEQTMALFGRCALPTGIQHGTVTVQLERESIEVTTFRCDGPYLDGRHPAAFPSHPPLRRILPPDFTVNAMAMDEEGKLIDPFGGQRT